jgi:hypothetical protein
MHTEAFVLLESFTFKDFIKRFWSVVVKYIS